MKRIACVSLLCILVPLHASSQSASFYTRGDSWQETVRLSREQLQNVLAPARAKERAMMGSWYAMGPFVSRTKAPFTDRFLPEFGAQLDQQYDTLKWTAHPEWINGDITAFPSAPGGATYLFRTLFCSRDTTMMFFFGSSDGIRVWVNGRLVLSDSARHECAANQDSVSVALRTGPDTLLVKVVSGDGAGSFYFSTVAQNKESVWDYVTRDYVRPDLQREMSWERSDSIFDEDWTPGDLAELGRRYARAYLRASEDLGIDFPPTFPTVATAADLSLGRVMYLAMRKNALNSSIQLLPRDPAEPRINGPKVLGVRPGHPVLLRIPISGRRPLTIDAIGLPMGLVIDRATGQLSGSISRNGEYKVTIRAANTAGTATRDLRIVVQDRVALAPPMGWTSRLCMGDTVRDQSVRNAANALVKSGLANHGWSYVIVHDNWSVKPGAPQADLRGVARDDRGRVRSNGRFPDMPGLAKNLHDNGLLFGLSSSPGPTTCGGFTGSFQHEIEDARQFGDWGVDYLQYDWCSYASINQDTARASFEKPFRTMRVALDAIERDVFYAINLTGLKNTWEWGEGVGANSWRVGEDTRGTWGSLSTAGFGEAGLERYCAPGHWNDPDLLFVGWMRPENASRPMRLTANEQIAQVTLWSLLAAPLFISCDPMKLDDFAFSLLTNDEVLGVNQDPLGRQARRVVKNGDIEVWAKDMEDGSQAVGLFNRGSRRADVAVQWSDLGLKGNCAIRDLWKLRDLTPNGDGYTASVGRHGAVLVKVTPEK